MLIQRLRRWPNIDPALGQCIMFAGLLLIRRHLADWPLYYITLLSHPSSVVQQCTTIKHDANNTTPDKYPTINQCWYDVGSSVEDGGPTLTQRWSNASCLLGIRHNPAYNPLTKCNITTLSTPPQYAISQPYFLPWKHVISQPCLLPLQHAISKSCLPPPPPQHAISQPYVIPSQSAISQLCLLPPHNMRYHNPTFSLHNMQYHNFAYSSQNMQYHSPTLFPHKM